MEYTPVNSDSIIVKPKFVFDAEDYKYLKILDKNITLFKKKLNLNIDIICENSIMYSEDKSNYIVNEFISLLHNLITRAIRNNNEDYINNDLEHNLCIKLSNFKQNITAIELVISEQVKKNILNELLFYENFIPQDIIFTKVIRFSEILKSYVFDLKQLVRTYITNV